MLDSELNELEQLIESLIKLLNQVKLENNALYKKIAKLQNENISLIDKNNHGVISLRKLIAKLQDELLCQAKTNTQK